MGACATESAASAWLPAGWRVDAQVGRGCLLHSPLPYSLRLRPQSQPQPSAPGITWAYLGPHAFAQVIKVYRAGEDPKHPAVRLAAALASSLPSQRASGGGGCTSTTFLLPTPGQMGPQGRAGSRSLTSLKSPSRAVLERRAAGEPAAGGTAAHAMHFPDAMHTIILARIHGRT